jgi:alkylation response protein AidB-like acyl-CoA dehydrogenase
MDLDFNEEQESLRAMVLDVCRDYSSIEVVRALEDDPRGYPDELWNQLGQVGLLGMRIGEAHGGAQQGLLETAIAYEEFGRALAPVPHFVSCIVSAGILERAGNRSQRQWLDRIAAGTAILSVAWLEPDGGYGPAGVHVRATPDGEGFRLDGTKRHVGYASAADRLIVVARTGDGEQEIDLFLVDPAADGVGRTQQHSLASDAQYRVDLSQVAVRDIDRIGDTGTGWSTLIDVLYEGAVLNAAWANGACEQALSITTQYAKDRVQFDKPLAAFQSIAHYLADARTRLDGSRTLTHQVAWTRDRGGSIEELAPMAKLFACQSFRDTTAVCQQIFGGIGFTVECDIQLYFRRAKQLQLSWWDGRYLEELIARSTLD